VWSASAQFIGHLEMASLVGKKLAGLLIGDGRLCLRSVVIPGRLATCRMASTQTEQAPEDEVHLDLLDGERKGWNSLFCGLGHPTLCSRALLQLMQPCIFSRVPLF